MNAKNYLGSQPERLHWAALNSQYNTDMTAPAPTISAESSGGVQTFSLRQRVLLRLIGVAGALVVRLICATVRYENSADAGGPLDANERPIVWAFWHRGLLVAT